MVRRGHVPQRMCAGCGQRRDYRLLVRFVAAERDGAPVLEMDRGGRRPGRGAWTCASLACLDRALKRNALQRRLGTGALAPGLREDFIEQITDSDIANGEKKSIRDSEGA